MIRIFIKPILLAILMAFPWICEAQIPVPQINLTGNVGTQGFPLLNSGIISLTSDANHNMTTQETSAFSFKVTSSVSLTATRNLIMPAGKFSMGCIENSTTGGQSIQVIGTTGTGVPITNGASVCGIWNDGTNYITGSSGGGGGGFPFSLGSTSIAASSSNSALVGISINGVTLSTSNPSTEFLNGAGTYSTPAGGSSSSANIDTNNSMVQGDSIVSSIIASAACFGDSITSGIASLVGGWTTYFNQDYGITCNNQAVGGNNAQDETWHIFSTLNPSDSGNPIVASMIGTNNTSATSGYQAVHLAGHAWAAMSSTNKILAGNVLVTPTGTQSADTTWSFANGQTCTSGPCTLTYLANIGTPQFFYVWYKEVSSGGNFSVTVDGSAVTDTVTGSSTISTSWPTAPAAEPATVGLARFPASNTGSASIHTIVLTFQTGATILGFGFPPTNRYRGLTSPRVFIAGVPPQYANANTVPNLAVNALNLADSKLLTGDGLYAPFVDVNANLDPINDFAGCEFTGSITGTTLTVASIGGGGCSGLDIGMNITGLGGVSVSGVVTALGTGTGGVGTYVVSVSQSVASENMVAGPLNCVGTLELGFHPDTCGDRHIAQLFESIINASPAIGTNILTGPLIVTTPAASSVVTGFQQFLPHSFTDTLISGFSQCSGILCGTKEYSGPRGFGYGAFMDSSHEYGIGFNTNSNPTSESQFSWPFWFTSDGNFHTTSVTASTNITAQTTSSATSGANVGSPFIDWCGAYWTGSASASDCWTSQTSYNSGANPASTLQFSHTGSPGSANVSFNANLLANNVFVSSAINGAQVTGTSSVDASTATPATSSSNSNSPPLEVAGQYWNGSITTADTWTWIDTFGTGTNPTSTYTLAHAGTPGTLLLSEPYPIQMKSISGNGTATIAPGAAAQVGTGATAVCTTSHVCDSFSGTITLTTATGSLSAGTIATVTFPITRTTQANCVVTISGGATFLGPAWTTSTTVLTIADSVALAASTVYTLNYVCGGN